MDERIEVRTLLLKNDLSQTWLINRLKDKNVETDKTELSSALCGRRKGDKVELVIKTSLEILKDYEDKMTVKGD